MPRLLALVLALVLVVGTQTDLLAVDAIAPQQRGNVTTGPLKVPAPVPQADSLIGAVPVFGSHLFTGAFTGVQFSGFNPDYQISIGDQIKLRMWGAFNHDAVIQVDPQGNIFIPNVGPVSILGVRNADLNGHVEQQVKRVYRSNVGVYVNLEAAQPVRVYVTGFVRQPGLYGGLSSDSILYYLDHAGGIDPARGSFLDVSVLRAGQQRAHFNLYSFLLDGSIGVLQLLDGDTIVVGPRQHTVRVSGEVVNPYQFEFASDRIPASELLDLAKPRPSATHLSIVRRVGAERRSEYFPLSQAAEVFIEDGDEVAVMADKYPGTILVRIEGAHLGEHMLVLPYGARLRDALVRVKPAPQANPGAAQIFRKSVAARQKEMLENTLRSLETSVLTARSATNEEATLRTREAELVLQFVERARNVQFKGQVVLAGNGEAADSLLEDGDIIRIPETSSLVLVHGEVLFPNAVVYDRGRKVNDYIRQAGGYSQNADRSRILVLHQNGSFTEGARTPLSPGDEIMVLPKVDPKRIESARGITQIIYQIAVAARIAVGL
jgi:protein involved in polysaccharide export with SLBB domain